MGGFGFRSAVGTAHAAYYSAVAGAAADILSIVPGESQKDSLIEAKTRVPMAEQIDQCLNHFTKCGLALDGEVLPKDVEGFWATYGKEDEETKVQKTVTGLLNKRKLEEMKRTMTRADIQRVTSSSSKYAGTWLTTIPSAKELQLTAKQICRGTVTAGSANS